MKPRIPLTVVARILQPARKTAVPLGGFEGFKRDWYGITGPAKRYVNRRQPK